MNAMNNIPSISSSAMLVELSISVWTGVKQDRSASRKVAADGHAKDGAVRVNKTLLGDCKELDAVKKFAANIRTGFHYEATLPWSNSGLRLLPTLQYFKYHETVTALESEFNSLVEKFLTAYDWEVTQAQLSLGDYFNADDYPTVEKLRSRFAFRLSYIPLPESGDFRLDINNEAAVAISNHYEKYYAEQTQRSMQDIWERLAKSLKHMVKMIDYERKEKGDSNGRFKNTLVPNVLEVVDLMGTCNVTNDPAMEKVRQELADALRGVTSEGLKEDDHLRRQTKERVQSVIDNLPGLGF